MATIRTRFGKLVGVCCALMLIAGLSSRPVYGFSAVSSPLFRRQTHFGIQRSVGPKIQASNDNSERPPFFLQKKLLRKRGAELRSALQNLKRKCRQSLTVLLTVALLWFTSAGIHSSAAAASPQLTATVRLASANVLSGRSFDKLVDNYVQEYMFEDEQFDPVESAYRETFDDIMTGRYPKALEQATSEGLGQKVKLDLPRKSFKDILGGLLVRINMMIQKRTGLGRQGATLVMMGTALITFIVVSLNLADYYATWQKAGLDKINKARYGDDYNVRATEKKEDVVEAPDDDDDEDADEDDTGDDQDEDE